VANIFIIQYDSGALQHQLSGISLLVCYVFYKLVGLCFPLFNPFSVEKEILSCEWRLLALEEEYESTKPGNVIVNISSNACRFS